MTTDVNHIHFNISEVFNPDLDSCAIAVVALSTALRDLQFVNLLMGESGEGERAAADRFYLLRLTAAHLHEMQLSVAQADSTFALLLGELEPARHSDLEIMMFRASSQPSWLSSATSYLRNQAFHYGTKRNAKAVRWALREFQTEDAEGRVENCGGPLAEVDLHFVGVIAAQHFTKFSQEGQDDEQDHLAELFKQLALATAAAMRLVPAVLGLYLDRHTAQLTVVPVR